MRNENVGRHCFWRIELLKPGALALRRFAHGFVLTMAFSFASAAASFTYAASPVLVTPQLPIATVGVAYSGKLLISATPALTSAELNGLPAGLVATHDGFGNIVVTGTPSSVGTFSATLTAVNTGGTITPTVVLSVAASNTATNFASNLVDVAVADSHACAVWGGGVMCWGRNDSGQLGDGTTTNSPVPVQAIAAGSGVTAVSTGINSTCAVMQGGVYCWGDNFYSQLGNGTTRHTTPSSSLPVETISVGGGATVVSVGTHHACAVVSSVVKCWGTNAYFVLGNGSIAENTVSVSPAVAVAAGSGATAISVSLSRSCAVVSGGMQCWGASFPGLGGVSPLPNLPSGIGVTAVSAGLIHLCAVVAGGVQCWGDNRAGQLGDGTTVASATPVQAIPAGSGVTGVSAGGYKEGINAAGDYSIFYGHTCAVVSGGVKCWGDGFYGQSGHAGTSVTPTQVLAGGSGVTTVSAGARRTCALIVGQAKCWGDRTNSAFGINTEPSQKLVPTVALGAGSNAASSATAVSAGTEYTCAVVGGGVQCWGQNYFGNLGNGLGSNSSVPVQALPAGSSVEVVSASSAVGDDTVDAKTCAVANGGVKCWGATTLGANPPNNNSTVQVQAIATGSGVTAVATTWPGYLGNPDEFSSCVVSAGGLSCWQKNSTSSGGIATLSTVILPGNGVTAVALGPVHMCVVINGGVLCWGLNSSGQLGDGSTGNKTSPLDAIAAIPAGSGATAVSVSQSHSCAVVSGGVKCWGNNIVGAIGNGSNVNVLAPVEIIPFNSGVTAISAAGTERYVPNLASYVYDAHTCAAVAGGVKCWGGNTYGQLGDNTNTQRLVPVQTIPAGAGVTEVSNGKSHSCAVVKGGVVCWGSNQLGQLTNAARSQFDLVAVSFPKYTFAPTIISNDLNADGKSDLIFHNFTTGELASWLMNGASVSAAKLLLGSGNWNVTHTADFDGDGKADMLLRNGVDGTIVLWTMNGLNVVSGTTLLGPSSGWSVSHTADFNADGKADILLRHTDGRIVIWLMDGASVTSGATVLGAGTSYSATHVADFNGDGKADILLRSSLTGAVVLWTIDGLNVTAGTTLLNSGSGWTATHVGDFNGDGRADVLWRNDANGSIVVWTMNGLRVVSATGLLGPSAWYVDKVADFNGDGKSDILLRNIDGTVAVWLMNGVSVVSGATLFPPNVAWAPHKTGDFNGDGKADIVMRNSDGTLVLWTMDGLAITSGTTILGPGAWVLVP
jgi:alpha-tubulin suppressor-like RCC1 family protein